MVNRTNRGFNFPALELRPGGSPDLYAPRAVPEADLSGIAQAADSLGAELQAAAQRAAAREGEAQAAADVAGGNLAPRNRDTVRDMAYDQVGKRFLEAQTKAAIETTMTTAYEANPDRPDELAKAFDAARAGIGRTGYADVDAEIDGHWAMRRATFMAQATEGAMATLKARGKAAFLTDLATSSSVLDQAAAGAGFDAGGAARVSTAGNAYLASVAKYGPKTAFSIAGVEFGPDESRADVLDAAQIGQAALHGLSQSQETWIVSAGEKIQGEAGRKAYADQIFEKWKAGDPALRFLDGADMARIQNRLEASASRAGTDERAARYEAGQAAKNAIEAFTWGGDPDFDQALADAQASGDPGLVAQVRFYRDADPQTRGVLRTVVARQLGLTGGGDAGVEWVDPTGAPRGARNNNPGNLTELGGGRMWPGQTGVDRAGRDGKPGFAVFATPEAGVAAAKTNLRSYARQGFDTVAEIVNRWAPAGDGNDPGAYAATVAKRLGVGVNDKLDFNTPGVLDHLASAMFAVETPGGPWATPPGVAPGSPTYAAWASAKEGFTSDPLTYARGGANRSAIANVPVLVPEGAFQGDAAGAAWGQALAQRQALGGALSRSYGVPARLLTNGEVAYYKAQIEDDPQRGIALAQAALSAIGQPGALALMRELGESMPEASATLHIADLAAGGSHAFAQSAAEGLALQARGQKLTGDDLAALSARFDKVAGAVPPASLATARATAQAAMIADQARGLHRESDYYLRSALGATVSGGRRYGGPASVNGRVTVLPRWLASDSAEDALEVLGERWEVSGVGPVWKNGDPVTAHELAGMQLQLQPNGRYRVINPRVDTPMMSRAGGVFEVDLSLARPYLVQKLGAAGVMPIGER